MSPLKFSEKFTRRGCGGDEMMTQCCGNCEVSCMVSVCRGNQFMVFKTHILNAESVAEMCFLAKCANANFGDPQGCKDSKYRSIIPSYVSL